MPAAEPATSRFGRMLGKRSDSERAGEERYERLLSEMVAGRVDLAGLPAQLQAAAQQAGMREKQTRKKQDDALRALAQRVFS